jgi:hypothetical protein
MACTAERLGAYAVAHGRNVVVSPEALHEELADAVVCHACMRAFGQPSADMVRNAAKALAALAHRHIEIDIELLIPASVVSLHLTFLRGLLRGKGTTIIVDGVEWYRFERPELMLLETRAKALAAQLRVQPGRKRDVALTILRRSVSGIIERYCGPESAQCYTADGREDGVAGLLYEVFADLQPWLLGLEHLAPHGLRSKLERAQEPPRGDRRVRGKVKTRNSRRRVR